MPRQARIISESGIYHIVFKGISSIDIFNEDEDFVKMENILRFLKKEFSFELYAYTFMSNHVHLLIKEKNSGDISIIMKKLLVRYVSYFNKKYKRVGSLIANRYKSQPVEVDEYFISVVKYIHMNPVKANIVKNVAEYKYSSYNSYSKDETSIVDNELVLGMISKKQFIDIHKESTEDIFEVNDSLKKSDSAIYREIKTMLGYEPESIKTMERGLRNIILHDLKKQYTIRQLERVTGVSRGVIGKC